MQVVGVDREVGMDRSREDRQLWSERIDKLGYMVERLAQHVDELRKVSRYPGKALDREGRARGRGGAMMAVRTPMGPAAPGSRLERRAEGQRVVNQLLAAGGRPGYLAADELGVTTGVLHSWRTAKVPPTPEQIEAMREYLPAG